MEHTHHTTPGWYKIMDTNLEQIHQLVAASHGTQKSLLVYTKIMGHTNPGWNKSWDTQCK